MPNQKYPSRCSQSCLYFRAWVDAYDPSDKTLEGLDDMHISPCSAEVNLGFVRGFQVNGHVAKGEEIPVILGQPCRYRCPSDEVQKWMNRQKSPQARAVRERRRNNPRPSYIETPPSDQ